MVSTLHSESSDQSSDLGVTWVIVFTLFLLLFTAAVCDWQASSGGRTVQRSALWTVNAVTADHMLVL